MRGMPSNAGSRSKDFSGSRSVYNFKASNTAGLRAALATALRGSGSVGLTFFGDSKVAGFGTNSGGPIVGPSNVTGQLRKLLAGRGYSIAGTGFVTGNQNATAGADTRWTYGTGWAQTMGVNNTFAQASSSGKVLTFTSDVAGEIVKIVTPSNSGAFSIAVDSSTPANGSVAVSGGGSYSSGTFTPGGSSVLDFITISGLSNATHTITITTTSSSTTWILGLSVGHASGLEIHNVGINGTTSADWNNGVNFYNAKGFCLSIPAYAAFISLGVNDARLGFTAAAFKTSMAGLIAGQQAFRDVVLYVPSPPQTGDVAQALWDSFVVALYDLADTYDVPLIDLTAAHKSWVTANSHGLMYDTLHETESGYAFDAITLLNAIGA